MDKFETIIGKTSWRELDEPDWITISHPTAGHLLGEIRTEEGDHGEPPEAYIRTYLSVPGFETMPSTDELEADGWKLDTVLRKVV